MRWNDVVTLLSSKPEKDSMGNVVEGEVTRRDVFCNRRTVGSESWSTSIDLGLRADAQVQVRSIEYQGEDECVFHGVEYDIERVTDSGEFTILQLGRKASND